MRIRDLKFAIEFEGVILFAMLVLSLLRFLLFRFADRHTAKVFEPGYVFQTLSSVSVLLSIWYDLKEFNLACIILSHDLVHRACLEATKNSEYVVTVRLRVCLR